MQTKIKNFPSHLPEPPQLKRGYKYIYRGKGWLGKDVAYTTFGSCDIWDEINYNKYNTVGCNNLHYLEIVKEEEKMDILEEIAAQVKEANKLIGKNICVNTSLEYKVEKIEVYFKGMGSSSTVEEEIKMSGFCVALIGSAFASPYKTAKLVVPKVNFKLNDKYTAEISKSGVKVGCQEFSFEVIKELAEEVKQFEKQFEKQ